MKREVGATTGSLLIPPYVTIVPPGRSILRAGLVMIKRAGQSGRRSVSRAYLATAVPEDPPTQLSPRAAGGMPLASSFSRDSVVTTSPPANKGEELQSVRLPSASAFVPV